MSSLPDGFDMSKLKDRNYKGDDFNVKKDLGEGPFKERRMTDMLCCIFFLAFLTGMGFCTVFGYSNGKPGKLIAPIDGDKNICGVDAGYEDLPNLFIGDIHSAVENPTDIFEFGVCVEKCPDTAEVSKTSLNCKPTNEVRSCAMTAVNAYATRSLFGYCIPEYDTLSEDVKGHWSDLEARMMELMGGDSARDLYNGRWVVAGSFGIALVIVLIYVWMMDKFAVYIAWISVALIQISFIVGGISLWYASTSAKEDDEGGMSSWYFWGAILTWVCGLLFCLFMACNWKSLRVSIAIIETAADWFADTKRILLIPFMYFVIGLLIFAGWVGCMI